MRTISLIRTPAALGCALFVASAGCDRSRGPETPPTKPVVVSDAELPEQTGSPKAPSREADDHRVAQPVQEYFLSFEEDTRTRDGKTVDFNPFRFYTHLGTDYGRMGPGENKISWKFLNSFLA